MIKKKKRRSKKRKKTRISPRRFLFLLAVVIVAVFLIHSAGDRAALNDLPDAPQDGLDYEVRGLDLSAYQGNVDFDALYDQGMAFVYIKATEGSDFIDPKFETNWANAQDSKMYAGAYHFVSFRSSGEDQAANFINTVKGFKHMLPPVIDLELYSEFETNEPSQETVDSILVPLIAAMKDEYGMDPVIYTTHHMYTKYIEGKYDNEIWIADENMSAKLYDGSDWLFCQYSFNGVLDGCSDGVGYIDLDVYNGSKKEFIERFH